MRSADCQSTGWSKAWSLHDKPKDETTVAELDPGAFAAIAEAHIQRLVDMVGRIQQGVQSVVDLMKI
eukprot:9086818-Pyramimonas_sp.AAC.1